MSDRKGDPGKGIGIRGLAQRASSKAVARVRGRHAVPAFLAAILLLAMLGSAAALAAGSELAADGEDGAAVVDELIVGPEAEEVVELPEERTADSASFELADGSLETRIYAAPVNFLDGDGDWERIGSSLREDGNGGVVNGPNSFDVALPERLDDDPVRVAVDDDTWIESKLISGDVAPVELEGGTASYESSEGGPSFELTGIPTGLKEEIEIADASQPSTYTYALTASADLQPRLDPDGAIRFLDASEHVVAELPPPSMRDSSDAVVPSPAVHYELNGDGEGGWRLQVVADEAWLADPQRVFPVRIDPTITVEKSSLECTIGGKTGQEGWIDCAPWGRKELLAGIEVGTGPSDDGWYRSLMDVQTTGIPKSAKVAAATFVMTGVAAPYHTSGVELREITQPWSWQANWRRYDGTHNWTSEGGDFGQSLGQVSPGVTGTWEFAMPKKVVEEKISKQETLRLMLKLIDDKDRNCSCNRRYQAFYSSSVTEAAKRPYLSVQWDYPVAEELPGLSVLDALNRTETTLSNGGKWSPLNWATNAGRDTTAGWGPANAFPTINGAYWKPSTFSDGKGTVAAVTMPTSPGGAERYVSLWLEMPNPGSEKSGYELRWTNTSGTSYAVKLSKWAAGTETVLASNPAVTIPAGATMAITDHGGTVTAWQGSGGSLASILAAADSTYSAGYAGLAAAGSNSRSTNFKAAELATPVPITTTTAATGVKATQATLAGSVNPNGSATTYQFEYGTTTTYGSSVPASPKAIGSGTAAVEASEQVTGLTMGTTYHYRLVATNGAGTSKGEDKTFTTVAAPLATTEAASAVQADKSTLNATINPRGAATSYYFEYGPTTGYGSKYPSTPKDAGSANGQASFSETLTGLNEGAEYHYRVVATNSAGTTNGEDKTFKTLRLPTVTTGAVEAVEDTEALLTGSIEPHGQEAGYQFEYGPTSSYGATVPSAKEEFGGQSPTVTASEMAAGLQPETTYHYRLVATSAAGTQVGADRTFATAAAAPPPPTTILPNDFYGLVNSGEIPQTAELEEMNYLGHSGAKMFRLLMHESLPENSIEEIFSQAADRGVQILPYFQVPWEENATQNAYIEREVAKYGPNGTFWAPGGGYTGAHPRPVTWWEVGNEPNLGKNTSNRSVPYDEGNWDKVKKIGNWFAAYASAARAGAAKRGATIKILLSGLFTTPPTSCYPISDGGVVVTECEVSAVDFITHMGHESSYNAVSLHPYAFKVAGNQAPKNTTKETDELIAKVRANIKKVRAALTGANAKKGIWVTELGFPVASDNQTTFPSVTEPTQATLIQKAMKNLGDEHDELGLEHLFIWNLRDKNAPSWEWNDGLRRANGTLRKEAWNAFKSEAGDNLNWPVQPDAKAFAEKIKEGSHAADASSKINPHGLRTIYWAKYGQGPITNSWGSFTTPQPAGAGEAEVQGTNTLSGLQPNTTFHYRIVAENSNGEKQESGDRQFTTPPSSSTSIRQVRILHGQPGYGWFEGWVKEGFIEGPGPGLGNVHVHINLYRDGASQPERFIDVVTNGEGHYSSGYFPIGKSSWVAKAEFPGGGPWAQSISGPEPFTVRDGVRIRAQHSNGCWDIFGAQQQNGAAVMHGACNEPPSSNQVFELVPQEGGQYLNIVARNSGRCVDVDNVSTADGSGLQQYDCLGAGQPNQLFREAWSGNYLSYVAKHSGKCVDVPGANQGWINLQQWTCNASPQQAFYLEPVESGPKPTETFISTSHVIHGNGQWGNNWGKISASGHLLAGAYSMQNRVVQVEFEKLVGGNYQRTDNRAVTVNADGSYELLDYALAPGIWRVRAEFVGNGEYQGSASGWHDFSIFQANRLVARHSGKCLSLSENKNVNGQHLIQWDCAGTGSLQDGQTFWFWPVPGYGPHVYEITVVSSGKCLDIANGSTANGAVLQQWDCNGYGQQLWQLLPIAGQDPYYALRPLHSYKCLDVASASTANGAEVWQWDCHWGGNQQWRLDGVVGG